MNAQFTPDRQTAGIEALRIPPHAIDAEQAVLGSLMLAPASLSKVSDWLAEDDFYRKDHRLIYRAVRELIGRGSPVDGVTLGDWFDDNGLSEMIGGASYLYELNSSTASAANIVAYAEIVVEKARLRSAIEIGMTITEGAYKPGADSQAVIGNATHDLAQMQVSKLRGGLVAAKESMRKFHAELMERFNRGGGLLGLPTPWRDLNDCTKGLRDGVLYIVGARPSMGKSVFGLQIAGFNALAGNRAAFFSVEMTEQECMGRLVACVGRIPHDWVEQPNDAVDSEMYWQRLSNMTASLIESPLLIDATPGLTIDQLMARARRAHMQKALRLIVIDHLHDMQLDLSGKKEVRHEYGRIAQGCKTMAKEFGCPVILLSQLNRAAANRSDKRPTMTDLRESGEIEQKADVILFLHREDYYDKSKLPGVVEVIPAKGRNIKTGETIHLTNRFDQMRLDDWEGDLPEAFESRKSNSRGSGFPAKAPL